MDTINAILSSQPAILSLFVITPDETVAHARSNATLEPSCPLNHLNRFYHDASRLIPDGREVSLSLGATCVTLRPLPLNWVLAVHHRKGCAPAPVNALQEATRHLPRTPEELEEEALAILTPDAVMAGKLGPWLIPLVRLLEEVTDAPPHALCHQALNDWIDREDPSLQGVPRFSAILAATIADPDKRRLFTEKAKEILVSGEKRGRGKETP